MWLLLSLVLVLLRQGELLIRHLRSAYNGVVSCLSPKCTLMSDLSSQSRGVGRTPGLVSVHDEIFSRRAQF